MHVGDTSQPMRCEDASVWFSVCTSPLTSLGCEWFLGLPHHQDKIPIAWVLSFTPAAPHPLQATACSSNPPPFFLVYLVLVLLLLPLPSPPPPLDRTSRNLSQPWTHYVAEAGLELLWSSYLYLPVSWLYTGEHHAPDSKQFVFWLINID